MKRCNSLPHSVTIACFSWWLSWIVDVDKPSVAGHPKQRNRLDSSPGCLGATCEARWTWRSHATGTSVCSWQCVTAHRSAADICARCQRYSCMMWQLLWTITETINTLFLVGAVGSLVIVLLQIFSWFWQWDNFENWSKFDEVKAYKNVPFFGPPCIWC